MANMLEYLKKNLNTLIISYKDYPFKRMKTEACIYKQGMAENVLHRLPLNLI